LTDLDREISNAKGSVARAAAELKDAADKKA
jgi:hypothetical protein